MLVIKSINSGHTQNKAQGMLWVSYAYKRIVLTRRYFIIEILFFVIKGTDYCIRTFDVMVLLI